MKQLKETWSTLSGEEMDKELGVMIPSGLKKYTIEDQKVIMQNPKWHKPKTLGEAYDGPKGAKQVNLANDREEAQIVWIVIDLASNEERLLIRTLKEPKDVFAWSYKDLKGVDPNIC